MLLPSADAFSRRTQCCSQPTDISWRISLTGQSGVSLIGAAHLTRWQGPEPPPAGQSAARKAALGRRSNTTATSYAATLPPLSISSRTSRPSPQPKSSESTPPATSSSSLRRSRTAVPSGRSRRGRRPPRTSPRRLRGSSRLRAGSRGKSLPGRPAGRARPVRPAGDRLAHPPTALSEEDRAALKDVLACCPELDTAAEHVRGFGEILTGRLGATLPVWIDAVGAGQLPGFTGFALHLLRDLDAVTAGLSLQWSSGGTEGAVNRIKKIKRQLYGRAGFELLRKMLLLQ
ncbi:transposase [Streptomyces sp. NPDC059909]|uniref:transposase n=1 Tax=Streptomyces sp. NPDC059909 TaxID=3346998 RepID=UPI00365F7BB3